MRRILFALSSEYMSLSWNIALSTETKLYFLLLKSASVKVVLFPRRAKAIVFFTFIWSSKSIALAILITSHASDPLNSVIR